MLLLILMIVILMVDLDFGVKDTNDFYRMSIYDVDVDILDLSIVFSVVMMFLVIILSVSCTLVT